MKACTQEKDDVFILFGGSGSEIVLCKNIQRNFISCEIHPDYYKMIQARLNNYGKITSEYKLKNLQEHANNKSSQPQLPNLFSENKE